MYELARILGIPTFVLFETVRDFLPQLSGYSAYNFIFDGMVKECIKKLISTGVFPSFLSPKNTRVFPKSYWGFP